MQKWRHTEKFNELAKCRDPVLDTLVENELTVPRLKFESQIARSRLLLARRFYTTYADEEKRRKRTPLNREFLVGVMRIDIEEVRRLLQKALDKQQLEDDKCIESRLRLLGSHGIGGFIRRRHLQQQLAQLHDAEALDFHLNELSQIERAIYHDNIQLYDSLGALESTLFWSVLVEDHEKPEVLSESLKGYKRYIYTAWITSTIWICWCLLFILSWLFRVDDEEDFSVLDWIKSFGVSSFVDFLIFTPVTLFFKGVVVPIGVVMLLRTKLNTNRTFNMTTDRLNDVDDTLKQATGQASHMLGKLKGTFLSTSSIGSSRESAGLLRRRASLYGVDMFTSAGSSVVETFGEDDPFAEEMLGEADPNPEYSVASGRVDSMDLATFTDNAEVAVVLL